MKLRGFEVITKEEFIEYGKVGIMPKRADKGSAGYDFYAPVGEVIKPKESVTIWTNVKAYMLPDEVLYLFVRSSIGIKKGLRLANQVGVIDSSYYENPDNDGNIGVCLYNPTDKPVEIVAGERIAQGVFMKYLTADSDVAIHDKRVGGTGSSDRAEEVA